MNNRSCADCHTPDRNFRDGQTYDIGSEEPPFPGGTARAFDTPTLRSVNFSAPYVYDGSLPTLAAVVDGEKPNQVFEGKESQFRLAFDELTTFATALNTLLPAGDAVNIALLVVTVAPDLAADAGTMVNLEARPEVYRLADTLNAVGDAVAARDWGLAETYWQEFQTLQIQIDARMF